jgi:hypothetical protein
MKMPGTPPISTRSRLVNYQFCDAGNVCGIFTTNSSKLVSPMSCDLIVTFRAITKIMLISVSRDDGLVSKVTDYGLDDRGSIYDRGWVFLLPPRPDPAMGPIQLIPEALSSGIQMSSVKMTTEI